LVVCFLRTPSGRFTENEARVYIGEIVTVGGSGYSGSGSVAVWQWMGDSNTRWQKKNGEDWMNIEGVTDE
jgi:hypothetical protein